MPNRLIIIIIYCPEMKVVVISTFVFKFHIRCINSNKNIRTDITIILVINITIIIVIYSQSAIKH